MPHYLVVARSPSDSDTKDPFLSGPDLSSQGTNTSLVLLEPSVVSEQDPSDSATSTALWGLREESLGLEWLRYPPHGQGQSDSSQQQPTADTQGKGPSSNPRPITGKVTTMVNSSSSRWSLQREGTGTSAQVRPHCP